MTNINIFSLTVVVLIVVLVLFILKIKKNQQKYYENNKDVLITAFEEFNKYISGWSYFTHSSFTGWKKKYSDLILYVKEKNLDYFLTKKQRDQISEIKKLSNYSENDRCVYNTHFVNSEKEKYKHLFDSIEEYPLNDQQQEAILRDEDSSLIVAGAGSGKTSTIIGKVKYILEKGYADPSEILLITFTSSAAKEMEERISERVGEKIKSSTFNALGHHILKEVEGGAPDIAFAGNTKDQSRFIYSLVSNFTKDNNLRKKMENFFSFYLYPEKDISEFFL